MSPIDDLKNMMIALLANQSEVTSEYIRENVYKFASVSDSKITDAQKEDLIKYLESQFDISMSLGAVVQEEFEPWLEAAKTDIEPYYWDRYKWLLQQKGFGLKVIPKLDHITDKILGLLENPLKPGQWERKGMVVGHVQSGKTANYIGLVAKAADAGYRLIIVIAGIHNNLRSQTQMRIDEGFIGKDSAGLLNNDPKRNKYIGVGRFNREREPVTFTTTFEDFSISTARKLVVRLQAFKEPIVLVIKKNYRTLENLIAWLKEHNASAASKIEEHPMLMIDDEADNASINTSASPDEVTRINGLLRETLQLFHKKCYVGYTATPFANIFIDPDTQEEMLGSDLFPRDFIHSLDAPNTYVGSERIFSDDRDLDIVRHIDDFEDILPFRHRKDDEINTLPQSLYRAVCIFVLVRAVRILRGQGNKHNSMLINTSRFTNIQSQIRNLAHDYVDQLKHQIRFNYKKPRDQALQNGLMKYLYEIWQVEFNNLEFSWNPIQEKLLDAIVPIKTIEINSRSSDSLDYDKYKDDGLNIIAIGGLSLSRGLTLEGLSVSYFLRNSIMYDTLMQMGRWFGYRPGYEDLCRIFMTEQAESWYEHISDVTEELRAEFREMELAGLTPKDFGLKVRSHPDSLIVTARNKMRTGETVRRQISLEKKLIETDMLFRDPLKIEHNRQILKVFIEKAKNVTKYESTGLRNYLWSKVPAYLIIEFIQGFRNHPASLRTSSKPVLEYIKNRIDDELKYWDIVLVNKASASDEFTEIFTGLSVGYQDRYTPEKSSQFPDCISIGEKLKVGSRGIEKEGLTPEEIESAEKDYHAVNPSKKNIPDMAYRNKRTRPLLMIHLLHVFYKRGNSLKETVSKGIVAYGISFPKSKKEEELVEYLVNTTWWKDQYGAYLEAEDE